MFVGSSAGWRVVKNRKFLVPTRNQILASHFHMQSNECANLAHEKSLCITMNEKLMTIHTEILAWHSPRQPVQLM